MDPQPPALPQVSVHATAAEESLVTAALRLAEALIAKEDGGAIRNKIETGCDTCVIGGSPPGPHAVNHVQIAMVITRKTARRKIIACLRSARGGHPVAAEHRFHTGSNDLQPEFNEDVARSLHLASKVL
jgi:hypothetical protein